MDKEQLKIYLSKLSKSLDKNHQRELNTSLKTLISVFPFNEYEYILMFLLDKEIISFKEYEKLRKNYVSRNRYLKLFGLAPRIFGEMWHEYIIDLDDRFVKPNKHINEHYDGQYDLWINDIKIEVKACRAINTRKKGDLVSKALYYKSKDSFWMNFQQLKLDIVDVFIFIGVWIDKIIFWVIPNKDVKQNQYLSHQHRGGIEYQIGITEKNIHEFDGYITSPKKLDDRITEIYNKR